MSHFTSLKTQIKSVQALKRACTELGLELVKDGVARGYAKNSIKGDYVIRLNGPYDVALKKQENGSYQIVTDWWAGHVEKEIGQNAGKLLQAYGVAQVELTSLQEGYFTQKKVLEDGSISIVLQRY